MSRVFVTVSSYHFCQHLPKNEDDAQKKNFYRSSHYVKTLSRQTPFRQSFSGREDRFSNDTILEQSVHIASHQTENDVTSNGISSVCLVNRELAMMSCSHPHLE